MKKNIILLIFCYLMVSGCHESEIKDIPEFVNLSIPNDIHDLVYGDTSSISYRTYGWFDLQRLEGIGKAVKEPFIYLRKLNDTIIVRSSDDIENPYILADHGRYWHCFWKGNGRGDSIKIDRFVINKNIYEYIQKKRREGGVTKTLISTNTFEPLLMDNSMLVERIISLGVSDEFDQHPEDHFLEILEHSEQIINRKDRTEAIDSLQGHELTSRGLRIIVSPKPNHSPAYIEEIEGKEYHYDSAPFGLYDENKDINRPYFLRRIK